MNRLPPNTECPQTMVQRMRAAQEAMESEAKEEEFYLNALLVGALLLLLLLLLLWGPFKRSSCVCCRRWRCPAAWRLQGCVPSASLLLPAIHACLLAGLLLLPGQSCATRCQP